MKLIRFSYLLFCALGLALVSAQAQTSASMQSDNWHIGLGISYRNFRKPKFKSTNVPNFTGLFNDADDPVILEYTPENLASYGEKYSGPVNIVHYTGGSVSSTGHYGFEESLSPAIGFSLGLWQKDNIELNLVANLQYFSLDSASRHNGFAGGDEYTALMWVQFGVPNEDGGEYDPYNTTHLSGSARTKFDMDLYVLDLGLSLNYIFQNGLQAYIAAGPSISLADMESSSSAAIAGLAHGSARNSARDNDIDYIFGVYASLGASYWITEQVGLSLELRYDEGFNNASTKFVSQNLDAFGGVLKCLVRF
jgi:opacity protein-like surface antigen